MAFPFSLLLAFGAFLSTLAGGLLVPPGGVWFHRAIAFAAGVLVAVPLFDLLPEALNLAGQRGMPPVQVMYPVALGFIFLFVLDRYLSVHRVCEEGVCHNVRHLRAGLLGAGELVGHSFLDGFAIGLGFHFSPQVGVVVAVAVIGHDFTDGINTVTLVLKSGNSRRAARCMLLADAVAPLLGAFTALFLTAPEALLAMLLGFFAGGFLYLGASDLLPEAHENNPPLVALLCTLAGFGVILSVTRLLRVGF